MPGKGEEDLFASALQEIEDVLKGNKEASDKTLEAAKIISDYCRESRLGLRNNSGEHD